MSNVDAIGANSVAALIFAVNRWERWSDRRNNISRLERAQRTWIRNHAFMLELGLDPIAVLGPPPGVPHGAPAPAPQLAASTAT